MNEKILLLSEAMSYIDDKYIEEAHPEARGLTLEQSNRRRSFFQAALVACLCIVAIGVARFSGFTQNFNKSEADNAGVAPEAEAPVQGDQNNHASAESAVMTETETETQQETETLSPETATP